MFEKHQTNNVYHISDCTISIVCVRYKYISIWKSETPIPSVVNRVVCLPRSPCFEAQGIYFFPKRKAVTKSMILDFMCVCVYIYIYQLYQFYTWLASTNNCKYTYIYIYIYTTSFWTFGMILGDEAPRRLEYSEEYMRCKNGHTSTADQWWRGKPQRKHKPLNTSWKGVISFK